MLVKNPLDKEVSLNHKGEIYYIGANQLVDFPEEIAKQWVTIYQFMTIEKAEVVKEDAPKESKKK